MLNADEFFLAFNNTYIQIDAFYAICLSFYTYDTDIA